MSNIGLNLSHDDENPRRNRPPGPSGDSRPPARASRPAPPRRGRSAKVLLVLALIAALVGAGGYWGYGYLRDRFGPAPDYPGPGTGRVMFEVHTGDTVAAIGQGLKKVDVVKSVDAFLASAKSEPKANGIQVGFYALKKQMKADDALGVLIDPKNLIQSRVTVTEGARVRDIVATILKRTDLTKKAVRAALRNPSIGLPPDAQGNPEGYLFPATYDVPPGTTALDLITQMVTKSKQVENDLGIQAKAKALGLTTEQVLTVASILEYEANRSEDYPKVARVIYNRLKAPMRLEMDSTISYIYRKTNSNDVWTTAQMRASTSAYNTYTHDGLPPGPIGSPGEETIKAALNPADGPWLFFVPDYEHNTTLFTDSYSEHLRNVAKLKEYCRTHDEC